MTTSRALDVKWHIATAYLASGKSGVRRAIHQYETEDLEALDREIADYTARIPAMLENLGLPPSDTPSLWTLVLPAVKAELRRRQQPRYSPSANSPIAKLKTIDLATAAQRFTDLSPSGDNKLRGKCPLHDERSPSFYIYQDSQTWHCFGACARGGDVVDFMVALAERRDHSE